MIYDSIIDTIGGTPLVRIHSLSNDDVGVYAKVESFNPSGSVKDRAAYYMLNEAAAHGQIGRDTVIIEPTSGNTGIGLAMVCAAQGRRLILTMPENMSVERVKILRAYGAEIVLTDKNRGMVGAIERAKELQREIYNSYIPSQFDNPSNVSAHFNTTAREIFDELGDVTWIVAGVGSGGTIIGIKRYIVTNGKKAKVCAVEPENNPMLSEGRSGAHKLQGIGANFVPGLVDRKLLDAIARVSDDDAFACARELCRKEGIFAGITSGAAVAGAKKLISKGVKGKIVIILPDGGFKYLSTELFDD